MRDSLLFGAINFDSKEQTTMGMTEQQKAEYKLYRAECRLSGVEPVRKDFLVGDIPTCVIFQMELVRKMEQPQLVIGAAAGR
jgi:paraquat-inducible protein B